MATSEVKFGEWIDKGFTLYKENFGVLALSSLIACALSAISLGILLGPMMVGLILITLKLLDGASPKPSPGDVFEGFGKFLDSFLYFVVIIVASILLVIVLSIVPCIGSVAGTFASYVLSTLLMFALFLIADADKGFWAACQESVEKVKPNFWPLLGLNIVAGLIGSLGGILCGIGAIITFPITACILAIAYRELFSGGSADIEVEPVADDSNADTSAETQAAVEAPDEDDEPTG